MNKKPLTKASQITSAKRRRRALEALYYGEQPIRDTRAYGFSVLKHGEGEQAMRQWYEDVQAIDSLISEEIQANPTPLPTGNLIERIDDMVNKLEGVYAAPVPPYHKRLLHIAYDELSEVRGDLKAGRINAAEAANRFEQISSEVANISEFSKFWG